MVKCPRCGYDNPTTSTYCRNCAYLLEDADGKKISYTKRTNSWNIGMGKKIVIVLGIIIIAFLLFTFIYNITQPTNQESLNVITDDGSVQQSSSYPYKAVIKSDSYWYAEMGDPNYLVKESGEGNKTFTLDCASWDKITISAQKEDYSDKPLTVQLLRNGEVVAENSTSGESKNVIINYN